LLAGASHQVVQPVLVPVRPGRVNHFIEETPTQPHRTVQAPVLVVGEQRFGIGFQASAQLGDLPGLEVLAQPAGLAKG
jgi:hypothetical protein